MAQQLVGSKRATLIARLQAGQAPPTFVNQSAVDIYVDSRATQLMTVAEGATPTVGLKIAANGGEWQPNSVGPGAWREVWARAASDVFIEVQP